MTNEKKVPVITLTNDNFKQFLLLRYGQTEDKAVTDKERMKEPEFDRFQLWNGLFKIALQSVLEKGGAITGFKYINGNFEKIETSQYDLWPRDCMWVLQLAASDHDQRWLKLAPIVKIN